MSLLLIRYHEPAIKNPRAMSTLQNRLINNIENAFLENKLACTIDHDRGRIYIFPEDEKKGIELLRHIFGIVKVRPLRSVQEGLARMIIPARN
jgi:adenylyl- and sulfurtransferase ThiI